MTTTGAAAMPASTLAADTQGSTTPVIRVADRTAEAGQRVRVSGKAPGSAGRSVVLQYRTAGGGWTPLKTSVVGDGGRIRFRTAVPRSGVLRALIGAPADGT